MTHKYISKLNGLIADINEEEIKSHLDHNLSKWCERWREAAAECSIALFAEISCLRKENETH